MQKQKMDVFVKILENNVDEREIKFHVFDTFLGLKGKSGFTTICAQMKDHTLPTSHTKSLVSRLNVSQEI